MRPGVWTPLLSLAAMVSLACGCARKTPPAHRAWTVMGTFASVTLPLAEPDEAARAFRVVRDAFAEINDHLTVYHDRSELSRLNAAAGQGAVALSGLTATVLERALFYGEVSGGAFDVTVGPIVRRWGFIGGPAPTAPPPADELARLKARTGLGYLKLDAAASPPEAALARPGIEVDLGGLAKGYAVDVAAGRLLGRGLRHGMLNLGGNIRCLGYADGVARPWRIGVRHPFERDRIVGTLALHGDVSTATSGNYEKYVDIEGQRYAHIIDPRTGWPVQGMAGVTVVATSAVEADAMSTALFVGGVDQATRFLSRLEGGEAILIPDRRPLQIYVSPGMARVFTPLPEFSKAVQPLPGTGVEPQ